MLARGATNRPTTRGAPHRGPPAPARHRSVRLAQRDPRLRRPLQLLPLQLLRPPRCPRGLSAAPSPTTTAAPLTRTAPSVRMATSGGPATLICATAGSRQRLPRRRPLRPQRRRRRQQRRRRLLARPRRLRRRRRRHRVQRR